MPLTFCAKNHHVNLQLYNLKSKDGSTWAGAWGKLTRLIPYMWPAKSASLQLRYLLWVDFISIFNLPRILQQFWFVPFQSHLLCIADCGGESDKCMGAHLPQDYSRRPLRREHPTRGIIRFRTKLLIQFPSFQKSWPWVEVLVWVGLKALQGGGIGAGVLGNLRWTPSTSFIHINFLSGPSYGSASSSSLP